MPDSKFDADHPPLGGSPRQRLDARRLAAVSHFEHILALGVIALKVISRDVRAWERQRVEGDNRAAFLALIGPEETAQHDRYLAHLLPPSSRREYHCDRWTNLYAAVGIRTHAVERTPEPIAHCREMRARTLDFVASFMTEQHPDRHGE